MATTGPGRRSTALALCTLATLATLLVVSCATDRGDVVASPDASAGTSVGQGDTSRSVAQPVTRIERVQASVSPPFRDLPDTNGPDEDESAGHEPLRAPPHFLGGPPPGVPAELDPVVQSRPPMLTMPLASHNFHGQGSSLGGACAAGSCVTPPDPNGAVGPNHYVQTTNLDGNEGLAIWNKAGTLLAGPKHVSTLWSGLAASDPCRTRDDGDPVVVYDSLADRWFITQFSLPNSGVAAGPSYQCVALSQTADPTGAYYLYEFSYPYAVNDYGKFGIWPDAYYATFDAFGSPNFVGADFCAYDRNSMLTGAPATQQCFLQPAPTNPPPCVTPPYPVEPFTVFGALPVSLEGAIPPPVGEPGHFLQFDYSQCGPTYSQLDLWSLHVDFTTPANSRLTGPTALTVGSFTPTCYPSTTGFPNCIPQPGSTVTVDGLDDRVMFRFAYRNFGQYESLVVNHSVVGGSGGATSGCPACAGSGVRWYEIQMQPGGASPTVAQQSTYAPNDTNWRWMASMAQDQAGDMALGFAISSKNGAPGVAFPSIGWTGRINTDASSTMGQGETVIDLGANVEGDAYPAGGGQPDEHRGRWGDYSNMTVDPSDDCTFWYTQELYDISGANPIGNWDTYIASAKFPNCAANDFSTRIAPATQSVVQGGSVTYAVTTADVAGTGETVKLSVQDLPAGVTLGSFNPATVTAGGTSTLTLDAAANAAFTGSPAPTFMVIGKATSAVHAATAQIAVVPCGATGEPCCAPGNTCSPGDVCAAGTCAACGATGQPCCAGNTCAAPDTCGGGGSAGVCGCTPATTCPTGQNCGTAPNGCGGTLACGACTLPLTCGGGGVANQCGCTPATTCTGGQNCNSQPDGCGSQISCGTCTAPQTCGGGGMANMCGCTPVTTCPAGQNCGTAANGCGGTLSCGSCTAPQTCGGGGAMGVCGCTPATTCPGGQNCGTAPDGCGSTLSCGTCAAPQTCGGGPAGAGFCGCTPLPGCPASDTCGQIGDGCGAVLQCGTCAANESCVANTCVSNAPDGGIADGGGTDSGTTGDAGSDSGGTHDGGSMTDSGALADSAAPPDSGARDGSPSGGDGAAEAATDAAADGSEEGGAGAPTGSNSGCGCRTAETRDDSTLPVSASVGLALVGLLRLGRRRRPRRSR